MLFGCAFSGGDNYIFVISMKFTDIKFKKKCVKNSLCVTLSSMQDGLYNCFDNAMARGCTGLFVAWVEKR